MKVILFAASLLIFSSCGSLSPKATTENLKMIETEVALLAPGKIKNLGESKDRLLSLKKGQWVTSVTRQKDGSDIILTTTRVKEFKNKRCVLEVETLSALNEGKKSWSTITISNYPSSWRLATIDQEGQRQLHEMKIEKVVTKDSEGNEYEVPAPMLMMSQNMASSITQSAVSNGKVSRKSCGGKYFAGKRCFTFPVEVKVFGMTNKGEVTAHSSIPVNGQLRYEDDSVTIETIAFGK